MNFQELHQILPSHIIFTDDETLTKYGSDHTEDLSFPPHILLKPETTQQVANIMKWANQNHVPVTPIGALTGLSGGALCVEGGIGLSLEKLNKIINIDTDNCQVTVEPAVITQVLQDAVAEHNLFYPVDPSSKGSCTIGGNVAENAGGARAVKYGVTKDYILNLEVVLPNGDIIWTGANTLKNSTAYNLTQLMVGSEGTLGVITKIVLKLIPKVSHQLLILVPFFKMEEACQAVATIFNAGITPSALEFMERDAIDWSLKFIDGIAIDIKDTHQAHLLIEVDGNHPEVLMQEIERVVEVLEQYQIDDILFADTEEQKNMLWRMRRLIAEAVKDNTVYKEEDTVVPRFELPKLLMGVKAIGKKYQFNTICYGHAGDGNLHINIIKEQLSDDIWNVQIPKAIKEIFELTVSLGGTISGEHGIGLVQKDYLPIAIKSSVLDIMKQIKAVFDPQNIMNPSKIFPEH